MVLEGVQFRVKVRKKCLIGLPGVYVSQLIVPKCATFALQTNIATDTHFCQLKKLPKLKLPKENALPGPVFHI